MSELQYYLSPRVAIEPIYTRGNALWRGHDRFLVKGINYFDRQSKDGESKPTVHDPKVDVLTEEYLPKLRRDIGYFQELGLNTVAVSSLDPSKSHGAALQLLARSGFYVLVKISEDIRGPELPRNNGTFDSNFDTQQHYTLDSITTSLQIVDELADHPNILGFVVSGDSLRYMSTTKIAEVSRAHIRDIKAFLRQRGGRQIPVGVTNSEILMLRFPALKYFTAGSPSDRIDFFAPDSWSWAHKSSFQISGWKNMVKVMSEVPVPMFLRQYGSYVGKERIWEEVECLYSRDMTGVYSGGCLYTFRDPGHSQYGIVEDDEEGIVRKKPEFETLKGRFRTVNARLEEEVLEEAVGDYENWQGVFPEHKENRWVATGDVPEFPGDWNEVVAKIQNDRMERMLVEEASRLQIRE
ncbi:hypothetical protein PRZ48_007553 [Zasmidium cellare]|uniref:1,3-beta-glucanosyltransferase n=1 Tax=Zasmidium cellare TaxID=395010 RepID=A0ABR0EJM1_ZASCE|nr:hypothetical protein PRZ48_007553 [Zasmidium cellare]